MASRHEPDWPAAEPLRQGAVFALGVDDHRPPAEEGLAGEVGLDQRRLAAADLPGDKRRRPREGPLFVEHPGVEAEARPRVNVAADVDPPATETAFTHERVGGLEVGARQLVGRVAGSHPHRSPRQRGRV